MTFFIIILMDLFFKIINKNLKKETEVYLIIKRLSVHYN